MMQLIIFNEKSFRNFLYIHRIYVEIKNQFDIFVKILRADNASDYL